MPSDATSKGVLYLVPTPLGNMEDITMRAVRILGEVDIVAAEDTRRTGGLLRHLNIQGPRMVSFFEGNEAARTDELVRALDDGQSVALVSDAGTPGISDPGQRLVARAITAGVRVEALPGPVAAITALVASGLPTDRFLFVGFPPRRSGARQQMFGQLAGETATMIFYEAPDRVAATLSDLVSAFGGERRAVAARELTKLHEELIRGPLAELQDSYRQSPRRGEHTLVVEGATPGSSDRAVDVEAEVRELLGQGLGPRDVAARLVVATGLPKRHLYQLALSLAREGNAGESDGD